MFNGDQNNAQQFEHVDANNQSANGNTSGPYSLLRRANPQEAMELAFRASNTPAQQLERFDANIHSADGNTSYDIVTQTDPITTASVEYLVQRLPQIYLDGNSSDSDPSSLASKLLGMLDPSEYLEALTQPRHDQTVRELYLLELATMSRNHSVNDDQVNTTERDVDRNNGLKR
jgi:hypothetical protein